jgi:hypothetical protein
MGKVLIAKRQNRDRRKKMSKKSRQNAADAAAAAATVAESKDDTANPVSAAIAPAGKKRGRTHLTQADKEHMQECRVTAAEAKGRITETLKGDEVMKTETWEGLPPVQFDLLAGVVKGVKAVKANATRQEARDQYIAACKSAGETPDAEVLKSVESVTMPARHKYTEAEKITLATASAAATNPVIRDLCDERATDARVWDDVPAEKLDAILGIIAPMVQGMRTKLANEAKDRLLAVIRG